MPRKKIDVTDLREFLDHDERHPRKGWPRRSHLAPFYPMKIAAGRRPAGSTALRWFPLREFRLKTIAPCARSTTVNPGAKLRILAKAPGPEETNKKRAKITIFRRSTVNRNKVEASKSFSVIYFG